MKWFTHLLVFALGILLAFWLIPKKSEDIYFAKSQFSDTSNLIGGGQIISQVKADSIIDNYYVREKDVFPLRGSDGSKLRGFYVDGALLRKILDQPTCQGVRVFLGKHDSAKRREFTTVFVGSFPQTLKLNGDSVGGIYVDYVDPCPTHCPQ